MRCGGVEAPASDVVSYALGWSMCQYSQPAGALQTCCSTHRDEKSAVLEMAADYGTLCCCTSPTVMSTVGERSNTDCIGDIAVL